MRTIKFRAWSLKDKCYLNSFAIFYNGDFADMAKGVMHNNICQCDINYQKTPDDIIIEQFTGLHDKNGVEIYEGDILETVDYKKCPNSLEHSINALPIYVIYEDGCFRVRWLREKPTLPQDKPYQLLNSALDQPFLRSGLVVIGNIHEEELK